MKTRISDKDVQSPDRLQNNLVNDYISGDLDEYGVIHRAVVVKIDTEGGQLPNPDKPEEPLNPPNSFLGRIITNSMDGGIDDEDDLPIFWPMTPHDVYPIKEGEHVYVMLEDELGEHGVWLSRVSESQGSLNIQPGNKKYEENDQNDLSEVGVDQAVQDTDLKPKPIVISPDFTQEEVPNFVSRVGDRVIHGSNNTRIVLGRDRKNASKDDGHIKEAGCIDIFAGKAVDGNHDADQPGTARIYIAMKTDIDENFGSDAAFDGQASKTEVSAVGMKGDEVRIVAKENAKIVVGGGDGSKVTIVMGTDGKLQIEAKNEVTIKCDKINLGGESLTEVNVLGTTFLTQLQTMLSALQAELAGLGTFLAVPGVAHPASAAAIGAFLGAIESFKSKVVKTK